MSSKLLNFNNGLIKYKFIAKYAHFNISYRHLNLYSILVIEGNNMDISSATDKIFKVYNDKYKFHAMGGMLSFYSDFNLVKLILYLT